MKLNPDCIRDCMLAIESFDFLSKDLEVCHMYREDFESNQFTKDYEIRDIVYTLLQLADGGLIEGMVQYPDGYASWVEVSILKYEGHQYLEKIKNEENWGKIKSIGSKIGDFSLSAIEKIAEGVTSAAINKFFSNP